MSNLVAYLLMRTDLDSLNPGKACAQAFHAGNQAIKNIRYDAVVQAYVDEGTQEGADFFNTCICLGATREQLLTAIQRASMLQYPCAAVKDPSYPEMVEVREAGFFEWVTPGKIVALAGFPGKGTMVLTLREEITCGWIIGERDDPTLRDILKELELHP